ncbi:MAG: hypothetical protein WBE21_13845 [Candidatus Acidiferrales bacterium]
MRKPWKIIVGLAVLGFAVTACFYLIGTYHDYTKLTPLDDVLALANIILCPPILLFFWCIDCEYGTPGGVMMYLIMPGLLNAALYAAIGLVIAFRGPRSSSPSSQGQESGKRGQSLSN